jgi:hypothetical protein
MPERFVVTRNPDSESSLPFLLRLPVDGGIELTAREPWPATARAYCHPLDEGRPRDAEVLEGGAGAQLRALGRSPTYSSSA